MESTGKESIVSRLFGFGKKAKKRQEERATLEAEETGFARTDDEPEPDPEIRIPEQVIRVKPSKLGRNDAIGAIGESFKELTSLLSNVGDRLKRQDERSADLTDQIKDLPEYLSALPRLHNDLTGLGDRLAEGNEVARQAAESLARLPEIQEHQARAFATLADQVTQGNDSVQQIAGSVARIPAEMREGALAQAEALREVASGHEAAIRKVAAAQLQAAKVNHHNHQKSLQVFHQATQQSLKSAQEGARTHKRQMEEMLVASVANMRRMFMLSGAFVLAAIIALVALLMMR